MKIKGIEFRNLFVLVMSIVFCAYAVAAMFSSWVPYMRDWGESAFFALAVMSVIAASCIFAQLYGQRRFREIVIALVVPAGIIGLWMLPWLSLYYLFWWSKPELTTRMFFDLWAPMATGFLYFVYWLRPMKVTRPPTIIGHGSEVC